MRRALIGVLGAAVLILNPFFACKPAAPVFEFGLADIEAALGGTWEASWTEGEDARSVKFRVEPEGGEVEKHGSRGLVNEAAACSKRTLVKSAHACLDETKVSLKLIALDDSALPMKGEFLVYGTRFKKGTATFELGDTTITARVEATGEVSQVDATSGGEELTALLVRAK